MEVTFKGGDLADLLHQVQRFLLDARMGLVPVPPPGYGIERGLGMTPNPFGQSGIGSMLAQTDASMDRERARQEGFKQGYELAMREQSRPEGCKDYGPETPDVANQAGPGPDFEAIAQQQRVNPYDAVAEANRKVAAAATEQRAVERLGGGAQAVNRAIEKADKRW